MPYAYPVGTNADTFDTESLEVLRGPQGVLQGRNSTGGVVSLRTRRPTNQFKAEADLTVGNYGRIDGGLFIAGPIVEDKLLAKLSVIARSNDSYFSQGNGGTFVVATGNPTGTNPLAGVKPDKRNLTVLVRPTLVINPTENLSVALLGEYERIDNRGINQQVITPYGGNPASLATVYGYTPPAGDYRVSSNDLNRSEVEAFRGTAEITATLPSVGVITSITGYRHVDYDSDLDSDSTPFTIFGFPDNHQSSEQVSQEVRFASTFSKNFDILVGGYYSSYDLNVIERRIQSRISSGGPFNSYIYTQGITAQQEKTYAAFANLTWHVTSRLSISAGGRYNHEVKDAAIIPLLACTGTGYANCPTTTATGKHVWNDFSPRASVDFQVTPQILFYGSYTKGFRSGAFNSRATNVLAIGPTDPESVASFEGGMKSTLFDNLLRLNLTGFHASYNNIQRSLTINTLTQLVNAANATIDGVEAEITLRPMRGFELGANIGYIHARYDSFTGLSLGGATQVANDELAKQLKFPNVPTTTIALSAAYSFKIPGVSPDFRLSAAYERRSDTYLDTLNIPQSFQPAYGKLDLSASATTKHWTITAFARNLNNARYYELVSTFFNNATPIEYVGFGGQPRTFGVEMKYRF